MVAFLIRAQHTSQFRPKTRPRKAHMAHTICQSSGKVYSISVLQF